MQSETIKDGAGRSGERRQASGPLLLRLISAEEPAGLSARHPLARFTEVRFGRAPVTSETAEGKVLHLRLADPYASSKHAVLEREGGAWFLRDQASTNGTFADGERLASGARRLLGAASLLEVGHTFYWFRADAPSTEPEPVPEPRTLRPEWEFELQKAASLARSAREILIQGESGVGKELLARFLHLHAGRAGPLISLNCAALPEALQESELFGHVKGAYSGAQSDRIGLFRSAEGGTLFLDEVGDMPASLQARLLRVLEERRVRPLGSDREWPVDVHILAATHRDLDELVEEGSFRQDLKARLGLVPIGVPPLRQRREDLGLLIRALLREALAEGGVRFEVEALRALLRHDWPLNVRELRSALGAGVALARAAGGRPCVITLDHLPEAVRTPKAPPASRRPEDEALRQRLVELLATHGGNVSAVARELGKARTQVRRWLTRFELE